MSAVYLAGTRGRVLLPEKLGTRPRLPGRNVRHRDLLGHLLSGPTVLCAADALGRNAGARICRQCRVLRPPLPARLLDMDARAICLDTPRRRPRLASLYPRALGLHGCGLDVGLRGALRLGHVSLWPLGLFGQVGWFWVPGNRWAPAWVAWRQEDDYLGWAPLPPTYDRGMIDININIGNVPDYYWSVVPSRDFLAADLDAYYVRDRRPFIEQSRPIGHTTIVNNTVVNNVVKVEYVEEKTNTEVVEKTIQKTKNINEAGRTDGDALEVYEPALDKKPEIGAPAEPKKVEEVAAISETKGQAEGAAGTGAMLTPPEVEQALKERKSMKARRDGASDEVMGTRELDPSLPKGAEVDSPHLGPVRRKAEESQRSQPKSSDRSRTERRGARGVQQKVHQATRHEEARPEKIARSPRKHCVVGICG